jgi:hypothetical protein
LRRSERIRNLAHKGLQDLAETKWQWKSQVLEVFLL